MASDNQSDFSMPTGDLHRVVVEFDQGTYFKKLIHPEGGCATADRCGQCGRSFIDDTETKPCYDCPDDPKAASEECWVQGWFDNLDGCDLLHGSVELVVEPIWEYDHCELHVVGAAMPEKEGGRMTPPRKNDRRPDLSERLPAGPGITSRLQASDTGGENPVGSPDVTIETWADLGGFTASVEGARMTPPETSICCGATVHAEDGGPDFSGDSRVEVNGVSYLGRTMYFVCDACGEPCDLAVTSPAEADSDE